jgi:hypothetical protein
MTPPTSRPPCATAWKAGVAIVVGICMLLLSFNLAFFNQASAAEDEGNGEITGTDSEKPKQPYKLQAADPDQPRDPAVVAAKKAADAEAAAKKDKVDEGPPIYQKWQFWALAAVVVVGLAGIIVGGVFLDKSANGGDVAMCPKDFVGCFGQGR